MPRRRRQQGLERVLGTPALFATAYGNVGSSIYYALGVTAVFALGLTPLVFVDRRADLRRDGRDLRRGDGALPGGGRLVELRAARLQRARSASAPPGRRCSNYVVTIAISAFFVPHYLSIFWEPLRENPWDIVGGARRDRPARRGQHRRRPGGGGAQRRPRGRRLRHAAAARRCSASCSSSARRSSSTNVHWGVAPTWGNFVARDPGRR